LKKDTVFFRQAELLLRVLPLVNEEEVFALKEELQSTSSSGIFPVFPSILT
jgi:hypothetical protein